MPGREKINTKRESSLCILLAPLDWGLGHTTRCLPIIKALLQRGVRVLVAGNSNQARLLKAEIPGLTVLPLEGYNLQYSRSGWMTRARIFLQIPKILTSIKREKTWVAALIHEQKIDAIISDCRFGLSHPSVYCVFITHQLDIKIPLGRWVEKQLQKWNYHFIDRFNECWIPDYKHDHNLAGELSHPRELPATKTIYIGALSRLEAVQEEPAEEIDALILVSGPEPQRSIFENLILKGLKKFNGSAIVLRGLPGEKKVREGFGSVTFSNHLTAEEISRLMQRAKFVISRAGYSTIMDIVRLRKKSILIPTPGQTEQEYLGDYLMQKRLCLCFQQETFSLEKALSEAAVYEYDDMNGFEQNCYQPAIDALIQKLYSVNS